MTRALVWLLAVAAKVDLKLSHRNGESSLEYASSFDRKECFAVLEAAGAT